MPASSAQAPPVRSIAASALVFVLLTMTIRRVASAGTSSAETPIIVTVDRASAVPVRLVSTTGSGLASETGMALRRTADW